MTQLIPHAFAKTYYESLPSAFINCKVQNVAVVILCCRHSVKTIIIRRLCNTLAALLIKIAVIKTSRIILQQVFVILKLYLVINIISGRSISVKRIGDSMHVFRFFAYEYTT